MAYQPVGTATGVCGALVLAFNLPFSGWGFVLLLVSSLAWMTAGIRMRDTPHTLLHGVFTVINVLGIYQWLIA